MDDGRAAQSEGRARLAGRAAVGQIRNKMSKAMRVMGSRPPFFCAHER